MSRSDLHKVFLCQKHIVVVQTSLLSEQEIISADKSCLAGSHLLGYLNSMPARAISLWQGCVSPPEIPS